MAEKIAAGIAVIVVITLFVGGRSRRHLPVAPADELLVISWPRP